ncbi:MAG: bifunctional YncE family protein/alkaline phosphatase family protein [Armatimonadetes bacterium]|nr:bifunctional YncE family protein/alkaline phosphatase family protein [Armatimonadota bacterium]
MLPALLALAHLPTPVQTARPYLHMPSVTTFAQQDPAGLTILPEGRWLTPAGTATPVARNPYGMALSPDGSQAFVASEGSGQWIDNWNSSAKVSPQEAKGGNTGACAYSSDGKQFYWGSGEKGGVRIMDTATRTVLEEVSLNGTVGGKVYADSYVNDLALSPDGRYLYCADVTNFRLAVIDLSKREVVGSVATGRYPYALALAGNRVYVANIGQFSYTPIGPSNDPKFDNRGLTFPPFAYPSKEAVHGVEVEGRKVAGLGEPLAEEAFSLYGFDSSEPEKPVLASVTKTGLQIGAKGPFGTIVGGSGPSFVFAVGNAIYVSNSNQDTVDEIDARTGKIVGRISLEPSPLVRGYRGVQPTGISVSPDKKTLYVTQSGFNSIAVIDRASRKVRGLIPTAWYPYRVAPTADGKTLAAICFKGYGNGPSAGTNAGKNPFAFMKGSFHAIPVPSAEKLKELTKTVLQNNGIVDSTKNYAAMKSPVWSNIVGKKSDQIKYVVFITKENHTFDTVFDRVPGTRNDPKLLKWGLNQTIGDKGQPTLQYVAVMVNHYKLARDFGVSDNFYMQPEGSGVGHRWLVGIQPNNFCQMLYTLGWDFKLKTEAKGRLSSFGSNGSMAPEDYPEAGSMWEHLERGKISMRNYGEAFEFAGVGEDENQEKTGAREVINMPMPASIYKHTSRDYPIFNMNIPDVYRTEWFIEEVKERYLSGKHPFPQFINATLCNDHGADPKPAKGYPYRASWMADNDLALGKMVEFLSRTPQWKNMLILVTEDDAGGEPDHVDAQRSVLLAISPYVKRKSVSHRHTTITSMHRTLYQIFGLPPLNLFDATSNDFADFFTDNPDFTPYTALPVDKRLYDWPKARDKKDPDYKLARKQSTIERDTFDRIENRGKS